jgi:branched-chain amino acid transport system ATP-binding protein
MKPELILLDEPASGLAPAEGEQLSEKICQFKKEGITFFIVEHQMGMIMEIADEVVVLHNGRVIAEGPPKALEADPRVLEVYMKGKRANA